MNGRRLATVKENGTVRRTVGPFRDLPAAVPQADLDLLSGVKTATVGHRWPFGFSDRAIQPMFPERRVVGTAVTLAIAEPDSTLPHHATWLLRPGNILMVNRLGDEKYAC